MRRSLTVPAVVLLGVLTSCYEETTVVVPAVEEPVPVEIEVEVYDPVSGGVWENVGVRVVQAWNEWSGRDEMSPFPDTWFLSDQNGLVYLAPQDIADYEVGFAKNYQEAAVLGPYEDEDEATVLLEIYAEGFAAVRVQVALSWYEPYVFVAVPFE